jgi:hypothetical protein
MTLLRTTKFATAPFRCAAAAPPSNVLPTTSTSVLGPTALKGWGREAMSAVNKVLFLISAPTRLPATKLPAVPSAAKHTTFPLLSRIPSLIAPLTSLFEALRFRTAPNVCSPRVTLSMRRSSILTSLASTPKLGASQRFVSAAKL